MGYLDSDILSKNIDALPNGLPVRRFFESVTDGTSRGYGALELQWPARDRSLIVTRQTIQYVTARYAGTIQI